MPAETMLAFPVTHDTCSFRLLNLCSMLPVAQLSHREEERKRIERQNPNPKMSMVRYVGGTWRVGGLLALSRAFGDAYLKGSLQFEGITAGGDGYSSGFGLIATPYTTLGPLTGKGRRHSFPGPV